ncbi:MAG: multiheme c-type cytochrome [Nitrospinota bacterium]
MTPGRVKDFERGKKGKLMDCTACHGDRHRSAADFKLAEIPTPDTCAPCHKERVEQFRAGKHALAWAAMKAMPMITHQPRSIVGVGFKGCSGCHKIGEKAPEELKGFRFGTASCDSCHTRHKFSAQEARDPRACQTCHMGFDHPQWEMWSTSKHGTIFAIEGDTGRAPTCQTCHMPAKDHRVMTAWGFLALRLPEEDKEWLSDRVEILKALGVLDAEGKPTERLEVVKAAKVARLTAEEWRAEREKMIRVCRECHSENFAKDQLAAADNVIREVDRLFAKAIRTVRALYEEGVLKRPAGWKYAPDLLQFYEAKSSIEQELYLIFLEYRMRAFQGAFHANPDYMHWYGWAPVKETVQRREDEAERLRGEARGKR